MSFTSLSFALQQVREFQDVMELVEHDDDDLLALDQRRDIVMAAPPHSAVNTSTIHPEKPTIPRPACSSVVNQEVVSASYRSRVSAADMVRRARGELDTRGTEAERHRERGVFERDSILDPPYLSW
jgi:hypothetical protein